MFHPTNKAVIYEAARQTHHERVSFNKIYRIGPSLIFPTCDWQKRFCNFGQGILKGEVSLYHWPPVWLVWISLFCKQKPKIVSCHTAESKPVRQEVNGTVILPPLSIPCFGNRTLLCWPVPDRFRHRCIFVGRSIVRIRDCRNVYSGCTVVVHAGANVIKLLRAVSYDFS